MMAENHVTSCKGSQIDPGCNEKQIVDSEMVKQNISALIDLYVNKVGNSSPKLTSFERRNIDFIAERLSNDTLRPQLSPPIHRPAAAYWPTILENIASEQGQAIGSILKRLTPYFKWKFHGSYNLQNCSQDFLNNFSLTELVGEDGLCFSKQVTYGIFLIGPDTYYPMHCHDAAECLYVLSGRGTWRLAEGPTISLPPSSTVFIPSGKAHAFWSFKDPMAAIYMCPGTTNSQIAE